MATAKVDIKLNGRPMTPHDRGPSQQRISRCLLSLPNDEVLASQDLQRRVECGNLLVHAAAFEALGMSCKLHGRRRVWGNPRAIKELRRQLENN